MLLQRINNMRKKILKSDREGYSLVELLIAMAITGVVLAGLVFILTYSVHNSSLTQAKVEMQDEAKDVMNHITNHIMEGNHVDISVEGLLKVQVDEESASLPGGTSSQIKVKKKDMYYYYLKNGNLYFKNVSGGDTSIEANSRFLLAEDVESFTSELVNGDDRVIRVEVKLKNDNSEFVCKQDVHIRNTCKGGGKHVNL